MAGSDLIDKMNTRKFIDDYNRLNNATGLIMIYTDGSYLP